MASKYDGIKTAKDLVSEVMMHGLSSTQEDICRAQDIFGHSAVEELADLATDIGRNDENGKPDPKGTWSSGRRGTYSAFYMILFNIWNWEDAVRFWNQHNNPDHEALAVAEIEAQTTRTKVNRLEKDLEELTEANKETCEINEQYRELTYQLRSDLEQKDAEIIRLKARLFDMMEAQK